jgi:hypothetical protein
MSQLSSNKRPPLLPRRGGGGSGGNGDAATSFSLFRYCLAMAATILLLGLLVMVSRKNPHHLYGGVDTKQHLATTTSNSNKKSSPVSTTTVVAAMPNEIVKDEWKGESYYHCAANVHNSKASSTTTSKKQIQDIVLWHGAAFTKEEWKASGILQQLCNVDHYSVTALDLSHRSHHQSLVELLHGLQTEQKILTLPLAAIVTPSASGAGIVDWINHDMSDFVQSVQLWVPVACAAVTELDASKMEQLKNDYKFPVLAMHGNQDAPGRERSKFLQDKLGAQFVELQGRHPCYLDSPDAFVETLVQRLSSR